MRRAEGFTLLEVVVATALTAGAVLAVATMSLTAYERLSRTAQTTSAVAIAQQQIEWLRNQHFSSPALASGSMVENLTGAYAGYTRTTRIEDDVPGAGIKQVTVLARAPSGRSVQLVSLIAE